MIESRIEYCRTAWMMPSRIPTTKAIPMAVTDRRSVLGRISFMMSRTGRFRVKEYPRSPRARAAIHFTYRTWTGRSRPILTRICSKVSGDRFGFMYRSAGSPGARFTTKKMMVAIPRTRGTAPRSLLNMYVVTYHAPGSHCPSVDRPESTSPSRSATPPERP